MTYSLAGNWRVKLDYENKGIEEKWFCSQLPNSFMPIPGTTAMHGIGDPVNVEKTLNKEAVRCLRQEYQYIGACFYQTEFTLHTNNKQLLLYLERVIFQSQVWIDDQYVGSMDSLSVAHTFDITPFITSGKIHRLTVLIDNSDIQKLGIYPCAYSDETQSIWNGIVGKVEIIERPIQSIDKLFCYMNDNRNLVIKGMCNQTFGGEKASLTVAIAKGECLQLCTSSVNLSQDFSTEISINDNICLWDEFTPNLYDVTVTITTDIGCIMNKTIRTGFRYLSGTDGILQVNNIQRFLRGNLDCCIFPLTGHPPMTYSEWKEILETTKEYGLNHVRFHSWCPPHVAFEVADELGLYLQVETPIWLDNWMDTPLGTKEEHYAYLPQEAKRIIWEYSMHPSFCIFSNGNEINGDFTLLENMVKGSREINPSLLYTLTTNWDRPINQEDDLFIAQSVDTIGARGQYFLDNLVDNSLLCFDEAIANRDVPVISHEVGQYVVYPDVSEIPQYKGVLKPVNLEVIKQDLEEKNMLSYVPKFVKASGYLSKTLYKAEFEAALRTKNQAGIQILSLQDFPGQSTATIGLLNVFFKSKGIVSAEEFRTFCNSVVPLAKLDKFQFSTLDTVNAKFSVANYSGKTLHDVPLVINISDNTETLIYTHKETISKIPVGLIDFDSEINSPIFSNLTGRNQLTLTQSVGEYTNQWDLWAYEALPPQKLPKIYTEWSNEVEDRLKQGETVFLCPSISTIKESGPSCYFPVFWSPVHFASKDNCGMILQNTHSLFNTYYPTNEYGGYEWKSFLENSSSMNIASLGDFEPLSLLVPNFYNNHKYTHLFEATVEKGKLLLCTFDFNNIINQPEITYLQKAISQYIVSDDFAPTQNLSVTQLKDLFITNAENKNEKKDVAVHKQSYADSQKSNAFGSGKGNDDNPATFWMAADAEIGHSWYVDLGEIYQVSGTKVVFCENAIYLYVIHTSLDGKNWEVAVNKTGEVRKHSEQSDDFSKEARYVKITYSGLQSGIWAGHSKFSVYIDD